MGSELTLRLQRGDTVIELRGEVEAVEATLHELTDNGLGALTPLFGLTPSSVQGGSNLPASLAPAQHLANPAGSFRFIIDSMILPKQTRLFADDVNGDGRLDNGFANVIVALESQSFDLQGQIDAQMQSGEPILLLKLTTELATPMPDQRAAVTLAAGKPVMPANHMYVVDTSGPAVTVNGRIVSGRFTSDDPRSGGTITEYAIPLPLGSLPVLSLPLQGLRLAFDVAGDGKAISNGQFTGSLKQADVQNLLVPALAAMMNNMIQVAPGSAAAQSIQKLFDTGGCTNPGGTVAQAGDGVIDVCELLTNPLLMSLLAPDVQIWNAQGHYSPNPLGGNGDSMSIGLGFSGTAASF